MARTLPFHTVKRGAPTVFHNNDACDEGRRVEPVNWRPGDAASRCVANAHAATGPRAPAAVPLRTREGAGRTIDR